MATALPEGCTSGNWLARICSLETSVGTLEDIFDAGGVEILLSYGIVSLERTGHETRWFRPTADTNAARFAALQDAMEVAEGDPDVEAVVTLLYGQFGIPSGTSITDFAPANAVIIFGPESSVLYADEVDAGDDARLYPGHVRYAENFGAVADGLFGTIDATSSIQAALFSLPTTPDDIESIAKYPDLATRNGKVYLKGTGYLISDTIYMTGFQQLEGLSGRMTQIFAANGFAPEAGPEKFMIYTAVALISGVPSPNFSFDIQILNIQCATQYSSNTKLSALYYGCGQGGKINMSWSHMGQKGIWIRDQSVYFEFENVLGAAPTTSPGWVQKGPHIYGKSLLGIKFSLLSLERLNRDPAARLTFTEGSFVAAPLACIMISDSNSLEFDTVNGESNGSLMHLKSVNNVTIGNVNNLGAQPDIGLTMVTLENTVNCSFRSLAGANFAKLLSVVGFGATEIIGGTAGPMVINGENIRVMAANPTTAAIPDGFGYWVKVTATGETRFWRNDGGVMLKSAALTV